MPSIGQNLKPFTGTGENSIRVKNCRVGRKTTNKQIYRVFVLTQTIYSLLNRLIRHKTHHLIFQNLVFHPYIGHSSGQTDVQTYLPLRSGGSCVVGSPPTCTAIAVSDMKWRLHGHQTYYVTIKAENSAGLATFAVSEPYVHDVELASEGLVFDIQAFVSS